VSLSGSLSRTTDGQSNPQLDDLCAQEGIVNHVIEAYMTATHMGATSLRPFWFIQAQAYEILVQHSSRHLLLTIQAFYVPVQPAFPVFFSSARAWSCQKCGHMGSVLLVASDRKDHCIWTGDTADLAGQLTSRDNAKRNEIVQAIGDRTRSNEKMIVNRGERGDNRTLRRGTGEGRREDTVEGGSALGHGRGHGQGEEEEGTEDEADEEEEEDYLEGLQHTGMGLFCRCCGQINSMVAPGRPGFQGEDHPLYWCSQADEDVGISTL
jgi:hypothetical protein